MELKQRALVLTVGGSHEPLLAAIQHVQPDFILFVCSVDDPVTGNKGSYTQILAKGKIIKANFKDTKPTLENIPAQVGFREDNFKVIQVSSDEIDQAYNAISGELQLLVSEYPQVICDYTGGTKSMSSSLVLAAVDNENVQVQVVAGARGNLRKIDTAFQSVQGANVGRTRFKDSLEKALKNWQQYNYATALSELSVLKATDPEDIVSLTTARVASQAFADWDVFDHESARDMLSHISKKLAEENRIYLRQLGGICSNSDSTVPHRIFDLWLNAERCAARGRYDDATSRIYRLLEWCSQWILKSQKNIDTADVPEAAIPAHISIPFNDRKNVYMASLVHSWELAGAICDDATCEFWKKNREQLLTLLEIRNNSILAHGYETVGEASYCEIQEFAKNELLPFMLAQFKPLKISQLPEQLPSSWRF